MPQEHTIVRIFDDIKGINGQVFLAGVPHDKLRGVVSLLEEMKLKMLVELSKGAQQMTAEQASGVQSLFNTNTGGHNGH